MGDATCKERDPDCPKPAKKRGWCHMHYERWRLTGTTAPYPQKVLNTSLPCDAPDCDSNRQRAKWCGKHYARLRSSGSVADPVYPDLAERFWAKVDKEGPIPEDRPDLGPCWLWTGANTKREGSKKGGYGVFADAKRKLRGAHACSYIISGRVIPKGYEVDHLCMVRLCVNPRHLEAVTPAENRRRSDVARGIRTARTHCPQNHEYTPENTMPRKGGGRICRTCSRANSRRGREKRRAAPAVSDTRPPTPAEP